MKFKLALAASTALALVASAPGAQAGDLYISVFGGANFLADDSGTFTTDDTGNWSTDADTGFVLGGAIGAHLDKWAQGLRAELEVSYRRNDLGGAWSESGGEEGGSIGGNMSTFAIMANAWYDIDIGTKAVPYVGGGFGWARMKGDQAQQGSETSYTTDEQTGFAWQLGVGLQYPVAPNIEAGIGYRYFHGPAFHDLSFDDGSGGNLDNENHSVMVSLTIGVN